MPELPEVESARRAMIKAALGKRIVAVECMADPIVFDEQDPAAIKAALSGRRITGSGRWGKYCWIEMDRRLCLLVHFGMTGWMEPAAGPLRFQKLRLMLEDGTTIAYTDPRRLGRIRLRDDPCAGPPLCRLGPDAFTALPRRTVFRAELRRRKAPVKAVLLDQGFIAGVGNWIADEVLYQARVKPDRRAHRLSVVETERIRVAIRRIIALAVKHRADDAKFPKTWLFHYRWGRGKEARDGRGHPIRFATVGGRTTAWVPGRQR